MGSDSVTLTTLLDGSDDGSSGERIRMTPLHGHGIGAKLAIVGGEGDVFQILLLYLLDIYNKN